MNTKVDEGKLISGKEALIALANGEEVEIKFNNTDGWHSVNRKDAYSFEIFLDPIRTQFRLKPRTIALNGIEVPAPFEPRNDDDCRAYVIDTRNDNGYDWQHSSHCKPSHVVWRTEEEIKQVVAALRQVFRGSHDN